MPTAVISGRVDERVKQQVDVVLREAGLSVAGVINMLWQTIASTGKLPTELVSDTAETTQREVFASFIKWQSTLPAQNPAYASLSDDEILELRVRDYE